jgi:STE24 endopeptidase
VNVSLCLLVLILVVTALRVLLSQRQVHHVVDNRNEVPVRFAGRISADAHSKAADYTVAKARLTMIAVTLEAVLALGFTLGGGLDWLLALIAPRLPGAIFQGLALFAVVGLITTLVEMPLTLYRTFVLEARFGFNRLTLPLFLQDLLRGALLTLAIGAPLAAGVLWMMDALGERWWLWTWLAWMGFNVLLLAIYPSWIAPLFNRFTPLGDPTLRARIEALMRQCGFSASGLFVMDGSRRSAHGNAYFTGFGRTKRVVFFDTLLERLSAEEIEAVLAHELGHFARRHVLKRIALMFGASLLILGVLGQVSNDPSLRAALGVPAGSTAGLLAFFSFTLPYLLFPVQPLMSAWSRRHEFEADAYAAQHANPASLISALVKLYQDNASTLTPDPWHSAIYDSHPPALARIGRLDRLIHA